MKKRKNKIPMVQAPQTLESRTRNLLAYSEICNIVLTMSIDITTWLLNICLGSTTITLKDKNIQMDVLPSPLNGIPYFRIYDINTGNPIWVYANPNMKDGYKLWITWAFVSNVSVLYFVFDKHFFERYSERTGVAFDNQLIPQFFYKTLGCFNFIESNKATTSCEDLVCYIQEGEIRAKRIAPNIVYAKTFINN